MTLKVISIAEHKRQMKEVRERSAAKAMGLLDLNYDPDQWPETIKSSQAGDATSWRLPFSHHVALEQMTGHRWQYAWFAAVDDRWNHG